MVSFIARRWLLNSLRAVLLGAAAIVVAQAQEGPSAPAAAPLERPVRLEDLTFANDPLVIARSALGGLPGSSAVGIWRNGIAPYEGIRDGVVLSSEQVGPDASLFESITKVFTGLLLAQAVERGALSLDDTLGKLLEGKSRMKSPAVVGVTPKQLITHTSCFPRLPADFRDGSDPGDPLSEL